MDNRQELESLMDRVIDQLMTTEEASEVWGMHQDYIKRLCIANKVVARKKAKTWLILRDQPNPSIRRSL